MMTMFFLLSVVAGARGRGIKRGKGREREREIIIIIKNKKEYLNKLEKKNRV